MAGKNKETVEVIVDDMVADPEFIEEHDPELQDLVVNEWGLDASIYSILVGHGITVGYLMDVDDSALSEIFSVIKWTGHKFALRKKLQNWPESALYSKNSTHNDTSDKMCNPGPSKHPMLTSSVTKNLLEDVLERNEKDIEKQNCHKNWLRNNQQPVEKVAQLWNESLLLRMRCIVQEVDSNKTNLIAEWPRLTDENGYLLIDADFCTIYGGLGDPSNIFNTWEAFTERFLQYAKLIGLKDDYSRKLFNRLQESNIHQDTRYFICCTIFHAIVKPVRTSSRKLPTILQAQTDMCYACETEQIFQEAVASLRDEHEAEDVQFFPRIFVIGRTDQLTAFYVVTAKYQYKLPSFLRCVDLVVKLKLVLNYNYPESCELFWYFVSKYFYNVGYSRKERNSQLLQLLAYLKGSEAVP